MLDFLKPNITEKTTDDDIYAWHANYITIMRRKFIILMNDLTRFCVVLYGLKKSDFKNPKIILQEAIIITITFEKYDKELIMKYIKGMKEVTYNKTKDRKLVSQLNRAMLDADWYAHDCLYSQVHQPEIANLINRRPAGTNNWKDVHYPYEKMLEYLKLL
jgi:hypothetical protein